MLREVTSGSIVLSFEDGPDPVWTPRVLEALGGAEVKATFFVQSSRALVWPENIEKILDAGHEVGLHSGRHIRHCESTEAAVHADTVVALEVLRSLGVTVHSWLPPWLDVAPFSRNVADRLGLRLIDSALDARTWIPSPPQLIVDSVAGRLHDGSIVRLHDGVEALAHNDDASAASLALIGPLSKRARELGFEPRAIADAVPRVIDLTDPVEVRGPL